MKHGITPDVIDNGRVLEQFLAAFAQRQEWNARDLMHALAFFVAAQCVCGQHPTDTLIETFDDLVKVFSKSLQKSMHFTDEGLN